MNLTKSARNIDEHPDNLYMMYALSLAQTAFLLNEVPVGAVVVQHSNTGEKKIISSAFNQKERLNCATAHAEVLALQKASQQLNRWRLSDCTLYVTLEPCIMCVGALAQTRIRNVVFGTYDPKGGACGSLYKIHDDERLNHRFSCEETTLTSQLKKECQDILKDFFRAKRTKK